MAPDERRRAIIQATLPVLLEQGPEISTREIARAAGVAEGTIFRAFETKHDLIHATIHAALRPDAAIEQLARLPDGQPLVERVAAILELLHAEVHRTRSLLANFVRRNVPRPPSPSGQCPGPPPHVVENRRRLSRAVANALAAYREELAVSTAVAARVLSAWSFASFALPEDEPVGRSADLAGVILHGIARGAP
jgi:AcrR family transcriptional regulator